LTARADIEMLCGMRRSGWIVGSAVLMGTTLAHAEDDAGSFLAPGLLWGPGAAKSVGGEISYTHYPAGLGVGMGPLVQGEWLRPRDALGGTYRGALGLQAVLTGIGIETAFHYQGPRAGGAGAGVGTTFGVFGSIGVASFGVRHTAPLSGGDPAETTFVMTVKWVLLVYGENPYRLPRNFMDFGASRQGRPLSLIERGGVVDRVALLERAVSGWAGSCRASSADGRPRTGSPGRGLRDRLLRALR
jgi:hypothetical protein